MDIRNSHKTSPSPSALEKVVEPLESVVGLAEMLCDRSRDVSAAARNEMIEQLAIRALSVQREVHNVVTASRLANGQIEFGVEPVKLRELVETVALEWTVAATGVRIKVSGTLDAIGDTPSVTQALRNVLEDASRRGARTIDVSISESHSKIVVEMADDGREVPASDLERLIATYTSSQAVEWNGSVLGLGVVVARGLARGMGGDLSLRREGGRNWCELTLRKHSQRASKRGQLPDVAVGPEKTEPTREDLAGVLDDGSIAMAYQPVVDIRIGSSDSAAIVGYESFARFPFSTPQQWFKVAGSSGVGVDLELLALRAGIGGFSTRHCEPFLALIYRTPPCCLPG